MPPEEDVAIYINIVYGINTRITDISCISRPDNLMDRRILHISFQNNMIDDEINLNIYMCHFIKKSQQTMLKYYDNAFCNFVCLINGPRKSSIKKHIPDMLHKWDCWLSGSTLDSCPKGWELESLFRHANSKLM